MNNIGKNSLSLFDDNYQTKKVSTRNTSSLSKVTEDSATSLTHTTDSDSQDTLSTTIINNNDDMHISKVLYLSSPVPNNMTNFSFKVPIDISVGKQKVSIILLEDEDNSLDDAISSRLSYFDRSVLDAVCTLIYYGYMILTTREIYNVLTASSNKKLNTDDSDIISSIDESLMRLNRNSLVISKAIPKSKHLTAKEIIRDSIDEIGFRGHFLDYTVMYVIRGGYKICAYKYNSKPWILEQAEYHKQIMTVPVRLTSLPCSYTKHTIIIRDYLIRRYYALINPNNKIFQPIIKCDSIYSAIDNRYDYFNGLKNDGSRAIAKLRIRNIVKKILTYWTNDLNLLKGYKVCKKGKCVDSFVLELLPIHQEIVKQKFIKLSNKRIERKKIVNE